MSYDLRNLGINDYTLPTGWFSTKKNGYNGPNILADAVKNSVVMDEVRRVWFEDFLPALDILTSKNISNGELYSSDVSADDNLSTYDVVCIQRALIGFPNPCLTLDLD